MNGPRLELDREEGRWLREVLLGPERPEVRMIARVQGRRVLAAVRTDSGPLREPAPELSGALPAALWSLEAARGVDRVVALPARLPPEVVHQGLLERLFDARVAVDPPLCAAVHALRPGLLRYARWLEDGVYAIAAPPEAAEAGAPRAVPWRAACLRLRAGRPEVLCGAAHLGVEPDDTVQRLRARMHQRVGAVRLLVTGSRLALAQLAASAQPISDLERAAIRGELEIVYRSPRLSVLLHALRLVETALHLGRARARTRAPDRRPGATSPE